MLKTGIFCAPLIQTLINKIWFKNKEDDGAIHPEFSEDNMLPMVTVAFVQTVVSLFFGKLKIISNLALLRSKTISMSG